MAGKDNEKNHAFIQVIDGSTTNTHYFRYDLGQFSSENGKFMVQLGKCSFTQPEIVLDIKSDNTIIQGKVNITRDNPIPTSFFAPGIMGWYSFMPFMECYHGILSMHHLLSGSVNLNQEVYNFDNGQGYTEKDWGRSFPKAWVWIQSNHFNNCKEASMMLSIADIPWLGNFFIGFLSIIWIKGKFYKFTTYTGAKITALEYNDNRLSATIENKKYKLEIITSQSKSGILQAPEIGKMDRAIKESLDAKVNVRLTDLKNKIVLFDDIGIHAGFEMVGDINHLIDNIK